MIIIFISTKINTTGYVNDRSISLGILKSVIFILSC